MTTSKPIEDLSSELESRNHERRARACYDLGKALDGGVTAAIGLLLPMLDDEHPDVRSTAADALTRGPVEAVEEAVFGRLDGLSSDASPTHRAMLIHTLGLLDRPCTDRLCETLIGTLSHPDTDVRFQAVAALNRLECTSEGFRSALPQLMRDDDDEVAAVAATAAANFEIRELLPTLLDRWRSTRGFAKRHLALAAAHLGSDEAIESLEMAIRTGQDGLDAIEALLVLGTDKAIDKMRWAAKSFRVHPVLRARAGVALAELDVDGASAIIEKHLRSRRTELRCGTIEWLGRQQMAGFTSRLIDILRNTKSRDSAIAAYALGHMTDDRALEPLRAAAESDPRADVREEATGAVGRLLRVIGGELDGE